MVGASIVVVGIFMLFSFLYSCEAGVFLQTLLGATQLVVWLSGASSLSSVPRILNGTHPQYTRLF